MFYTVIMWIKVLHIMLKMTKYKIKLIKLAKARIAV